MRTDEEYRQILQLWEQGTPKKRIARLTGIPRETVRDCIQRYQTVANLGMIRAEYPTAPYTLRQLQSEATSDPPLREAYAYLLGLYLGDGYINREPRTYRLRVSLAAAYPGIIQTCIEAIRIE